MASNRKFHDMLGNVSQTFSLITCWYKIYFYNVGFIGSNDGPFAIQVNAIARKGFASDNMVFSRKHGSLGPLDLLGDPLDS